MMNCKKNITKFKKKLKIEKFKEKFHTKPVYNEKNLKTKIKSYNGKINTSFHNNKIPKEGSQLIHLSVTLIDFFSKQAKLLSSSVFRRMFISC